MGTLATCGADAWSALHPQHAAQLLSWTRDGVAGDWCGFAVVQKSPPPRAARPAACAGITVAASIAAMVSQAVIRRFMRRILLREGARRRGRSGRCKPHGIIAHGQSLFH